MHKVHISATELKNRVSEVLNEVYYKGSVTIVERHGKPIAEIVPVKKERRIALEEIKRALDATFGSVPNFPDVTTLRRFRKRKIDLP